MEEMEEEGLPSWQCDIWEEEIKKQNKATGGDE